MLMDDQNSIVQPDETALGQVQQLEVQPEALPDQIASEESRDVEFSPATISWTADEFIVHEKSQKWFIYLWVGAGLMVVAALFLLKDWIFALLIAVMAATVMVITRRTPREMNYTLSQEGLTVGDKFFSMDSFSHFGLVKEGAVWNLRLVSNRRFVPPVTAYLPHDQGEQIVDLLGALLPMEDVQTDIIDKIVTKTKI